MCCAFCQTVREDMTIIDICMVVLGSIVFFHYTFASRHSDNTPDSRRVPFSVHESRAFRTMQAALRTATAVVSSYELV